MTTNEVVGENIKLFRNKLELTQEALAEYLGISREEVSYYETGRRDIPTSIVTKAAKLFGIDDYDLYETEESLNLARMAFAFRINSINSECMNNIADFKKIVLNYIGMKKALDNESINS